MYSKQFLRTGLAFYRVEEGKVILQNIPVIESIEYGQTSYAFNAKSMSIMDPAFPHFTEVSFEDFIDMKVWESFTPAERHLNKDPILPLQEKLHIFNMIKESGQLDNLEVSSYAWLAAMPTSTSAPKRIFS